MTRLKYPQFFALAPAFSSMMLHSRSLDDQLNSTSSANTQPQHHNAAAMESEDIDHEITEGNPPKDNNDVSKGLSSSLAREEVRPCRASVTCPGRASWPRLLYLLLCQLHLLDYC